MTKVLPPTHTMLVLLYLKYLHLKVSATKFINLKLFQFSLGNIKDS